MSGGSYRINDKGERELVSKPFRSPSRAERRAAEQAAAEAAAATVEELQAEEPKPARRRGKTTEPPIAEAGAGDATSHPTEE